MRIDSRKLSHIDWKFVLFFFVLLGIGLLNLYSAVSPSYHLFKKQLFILFFGLVFLLLSLSFDYRRIAENSFWLYAFFLSMIILTFLFGPRTMGAKRWISLFGMKFQPSEFMKLVIILILAQMLHEKKSANLKLGIKELLLPFLLVTIPVILVLLQPDLGTAIIIFIVSLSILFYIGLKKYLYVIFPIFGALASYIFWNHLLKPYQKIRLLIFFNLISDPQGFGYHMQQAEIAVGSGKIFGKGFLQGTQHKLQFVPEHHTDFIFTVFAEEWGFIGSIVLILFFLYFIYQCLKISQRAGDELGSIIAFGIASLIFFQFSINIFMALHLLPAVGIPLPFMSYGGSSLLCLLFAVGMLLNIEMRRYMF